MNRDQLESVIWRELADHGRRQYHGLPRGENDVLLVNAILASADSYALTGDTPADRREVLYAARDDIGDQCRKAANLARTS